MKLFAIPPLMLAIAVTTARAADDTVAMEMSWEELPALPDAFGFGGPIVGTNQGALIVAGGANFPNGPPWPTDKAAAGSKVWHDRVFVLENAGSQWRSSFRLPRPLAYAATVSTEEGIFVIGGETFGDRMDPGTGVTTQSNFPIADVLLVRWNPSKQAIEIVDNALPPLPKPSCYHGAGLIRDVIYVVASHAAGATSDRLDTKSFWSLDLSKPGRERKWQALTPWPGPARHKMAVAVQNATGVDGQIKTTCLFLISGATWVNGPDGKPDLARFKHFIDGYAYHPAPGTWRKIVDLPVLPERREINLSGYAFDRRRAVWRHLQTDEELETYQIDELFSQARRPAAASVAIDSGKSHVLLFSGATGRFITLDLPDRPIFPPDVLAYDTIANAWSHVGRMPRGVVTTSAVSWNDSIVIPSGEIRPGVRTPTVQTVRVTRQDRP